MSYEGGDNIEVTYNHPTLGNGTIYCKSAEDGTFNPGGFRSNDDDNMISGDGQMIDQINRVRWSFEMTIAWDITDVDEVTKLSSLAGSPVETNWTISNVSGAIWAGKGKPVGDLKGATNQSTAPVKLAGSGLLKEIS